VVLTALRGAMGFLTRLPVGRSDRHWAAFGDAPAVMVGAAYPIGLLAVLALLWLPGPVAALSYPLALVTVTGITHADGLADLGDAAVIHGSAADRRAVMADAHTGVGGSLALGLDVVGLALAGLALAETPPAVAVGVVVAAEVGAKLAMVTVTVVGDAAHGGMGAHVVGASGGQFVAGLVLAAPAAVVAWPSLVPVVALSGAVVGGLAVYVWARGRIGGVSGDVFGAVNEVGRLLALHLGVVAWTLW
jgi:adenosylcobinamide-GDP ribazoletransferase